MSFPKKKYPLLFSDNADRKLPPELQDIELWQTNRRTFLKAAILTGALSQLSFLQSCSDDEIEKGNDLLTGEQVTILKSVLLILFPNDGNGPSADDLHTYEYIMWVLKDPGANQENNKYVLDGIDWTNEAAEKLFGEKYIALKKTEQAKLISKFLDVDYGHDWCSILITLILESLLLDPIYGGNPDGVGWKWLNHSQGFPQPTEELRYDNLLQTVRLTS